MHSAFNNSCSYKAAVQKPEQPYIEKLWVSIDFWVTSWRTWNRGDINRVVGCSKICEKATCFWTEFNLHRRMLSLVTIIITFQFMWLYCMSEKDVSRLCPQGLCVCASACLQHASVLRQACNWSQSRHRKAPKLYDSCPFCLSCCDWFSVWITTHLYMYACVIVSCR